MTKTEAIEVAKQIRALEAELAEEGMAITSLESDNSKTHCPSPSESHGKTKNAD